MAISITSEQIYLDGVAQTTPQTSGSIKFCYAGYNTSYKTRYVTLYTCSTTTPLSQITFSITAAGQDGTSADKSLGIYVTTTKSNTYLTSSTGGDTKLRFSKTCVDDGEYTSSGSSTLAIGTVTKTIPVGTFYVYVVPYSNTSWNTISTYYSKSSTTAPVEITGVSIPIYKATLNNQSATTAGTTALWYMYNTYISPYHYYTNSTCTTGLANYTITKPTKTGYTFGGYFTSTDGGGTQYINSSGVCVNNLYKTSGNKTLYAKWTGNQYTMKIDPCGGEYNGSTSVYTLSTKLQYGSSTLKAIKVATRPGYTLTGYYTAATGGTKVYNADGTCVKGTTYWNTSEVYCYAGNLTLYAQWSADGLAYIDNGSKIESYQCFIEDGSEFDTYAPYIEDGTTWHIYS